MYSYYAILLGMNSELTKHRQKEIKVNGNSVYVDVAILPIVNFINSFKGTHTVSSCCGRSYCGKNYFNPHVSFVTTCINDIENVIEKFSKNRTDYVMTQYTTLFGRKDLFRYYTIDFSSYKQMKDFSRFISSYPT